MRKIFTILLVLVIGLSNDIYAQSKQNKELATVMGIIKEDSQDHIFTSFSNVRLIAGKDTLKKVATQNKFVFEDIVPGVRGATAGGFYTVAVYDEHCANPELLQAICDRYIYSFSELLSDDIF